MLSYLAAALPAGTPASARLLALQCALRMNAAMHVRLPKGLLRGLRLDHPVSWRQLEQARWLRTRPVHAAEIVAELLDTALLAQAPARPDRMQAADWALRLTSASATGPAASPQLQLVHLYLAAHTDPDTGAGSTELDQMARACGTHPAELLNVIHRLAEAGPFRPWHACSDADDLHWNLATRPDNA
ncbi:hypothetical protein [Streptomyces sp. NPDC050534]|uniref:hypothetical protein n=1 Tax=Streptomyces sp. NPDC050534 TaxID=3365625 RepID=UPI0037985C65